MTDETSQRLKLAADHYSGSQPRILFCSGFKSNKAGTKAEFLRRLAADKGWAYSRFDYQGHGESPGEFEHGTISCWLEDTLSVIDATNEPLIIVGSSMGGWIALLATLKRPQRVAGLLTMACATDFTSALIEKHINESQKLELQHNGVIYLPSDYDDGEPYAITNDLIEDGHKHRLLEDRIEINCPVRMIHGTADPDVHWQTSSATLERLTSADARLLLLKDADHRLSKPQELALIGQSLSELYEQLL